MDYTSFLEDMGEQPGGMTIERIDNDGDYNPGNCKWATRLDQANNKRNNRVADTSHGRMTAAQISRMTGIAYQTIIERFKRGWVGDALLKPVQEKPQSMTS